MPVRIIAKYSILILLPYLCFPVGNNWCSLGYHLPNGYSNHFENSAEMNTYDKCDIHIASHFVNNVSNIHPSALDSLFNTYSDKCKNNTEFTQLYNKAIFNILKTFPQLFADRFILLNQSTKESILNILENPIDDSINISNLIISVTNSLHNSISKQHIINALMIASSKGN